MERAMRAAEAAGVGVGLLAVLLAGACGNGPRPCGPEQVLCPANADCLANAEGVEACACREGYVRRAERCHPEGPCGALATRWCEAVGDEARCRALREGIATADGAACEQQLGQTGIEVSDAARAWVAEISAIRERRLPPEYRVLLARSLLDPCGAAVELLCAVMRPGDPHCGDEVNAVAGDVAACRALVSSYDRVVLRQAEFEGSDVPAETPALEGAGVLVRLIPDPGNTGTIEASAFRAKLVAERVEIEACYQGAAEVAPGLAGRAVYQVRIAEAGTVVVELGRADGAIRGSGVADCVRESLARLDFSDAPPQGGTLAVHVVLDFGIR